GLRMVASIALAEMPRPPLIGLPGPKALRRLPHGALPFGIDDSRSDSGSDRLGYLILHGKYVRKVSVVSLGPHVAGIGRVDQLSRHPDSICRALHAPLEDIADAKLTADPADVERLAAVGETRVSCNHEQPAQLRQRGHQIFGDAIAEELLCRIARHV